MREIGADEQLAGEEDRSFACRPGLQGERCGNCGHDLTDYRNPEAFWKTGRIGCDECPKCKWNPNWNSTFIKNLDKNIICVCKQCGEKNVQRVRARRIRYWLEKPSSDTETKSVDVDEASDTHEHCASCREENQARVHYANYQRAVKRSKEKRESQRRGVRRFEEAMKKAEEKAEGKKVSQPE